LATLRRWVNAKVPSYPAAFDDATTLKLVLEDQAKLDPTTRRYARYISVGHLVNETSFEEKLFTFEKRVRATWDSVAAKAALPPEVIDDTATLYRFDLRSARWHRANLPKQELFEVVKQDVASGAADLAPFDLILLDYPYDVAIPAAQLQAWGEFLKAIRPSELVTEVPFLRGDWLVNALLDDNNEPTPLGLDLKSLDELAEAFANTKPAPAGPTFRPFSGATNLVSHGRGWASWSARSVTNDPPAFQVVANAINRSGDTLTEVSLNTPYSLLLTADKDVWLNIHQVYDDGQVLTVKPRGTPQAKANTEKRIVPDDTEDAAFNHVSLPGDRDSMAVWYVIYASDKPLSAPVIVRSRHGSQPIYRIIPSVPRDAAIVRQVVSLNIKR
jgi:hypothetical protein